METENDLFASKQCTKVEDEVKCRNPPGSFQEKFEYFTALQYDSSANLCYEEEPIDLTNYRDVEMNMPQEMVRQYENFEPRSEAQPFQILNNCPESTFNVPRDNYFPKRRRKGSKFVYTPEGKILLVSEDPNRTAKAFTPAKQQEILSAAKALFSKRTRTLYHWMYPHAAKQQIKTAIADSWDSLEDREKEFYISQVLGRFGFPQTDLMINPQLGSIKHLPPPSPPLAQKRAIQLPAGAARGQQQLALLSSLGGYDEGMKRRGRPKGSHVRKRAREDFQDDPELSQELEKFVTTFNLSNVV